MRKKMEITIQINEGEFIIENIEPISPKNMLLKENMVIKNE